MHSSSWDTSLHLACESGNKELVQWIYNRASDPKHWLVEGHINQDYPWERALWFDHLEIALTLLKCQAEHIDSVRLYQSLPLVCDQDVKFIQQAMELIQPHLRPISGEAQMQNGLIGMLPYTILYTALENDNVEAFMLVKKVILPADAEDGTLGLPVADLMVEAILCHCSTMIRFIWDNSQLSGDFETLLAGSLQRGLILSPDVVVFLLCFVQPWRIEQRFVSVLYISYVDIDELTCPVGRSHGRGELFHLFACTGNVSRWRLGRGADQTIWFCTGSTPSGIEAGRVRTQTVRCKIFVRPVSIGSLTPLFWKAHWRL